MRKAARRTGGALGLAFVAAVWSTSLRELHRRNSDPGVPILGVDDLRHRVDLNSAGAAELALLPGVGPRLADRLLRERRRGAFRSLAECARRVPGIGPVRVRWWDGLAHCGVEEER